MLDDRMVASDSRPVRTARTVADAMLTDVKLSRPTSTVGELRTLFDNEHVHAALLVEGRWLLAVVDRADLVGAVDEAPALPLGSLPGRTVAPGLALDLVWRQLLESGQRRLAVVGDDGSLLGLLCLKRRRTGFCSDRDIRARRM